MTASSKSASKSILFLCMGNICRSPLAEGIARHVLEQQGPALLATFDSAGTHAYHVGNPPDSRAIDVAARNGVNIAGLRARQVSMEDFGRFDLILAADQRNLHELRRLQPNGDGAELDLLLPWTGLKQLEVPDPYYGGPADFERVFALLADAMQGLRERLLQGG